MDRLVVHFPLALRAASIPAGPLAHGPSHPRPVFLTASASVSCPSPWQPPAGLWLLELPCPPCGVCRARLLGSLHQPRTERGSRLHAWPSLTIPLGRLNSERPPLIWPRAILSSGLSPSRIPVKKLERYASTLCHQQDSQPTKHTHLLSEIQAQSVEDQGMYLNLHIVSCFLLIVSLSFCKKWASPPCGVCPGQSAIQSSRRHSSLAIRGEIGVKNSLSSPALKTAV